MDKFFTCAECKGTFEKGWTDEEAWQEADELWMPDELAAGTDVICDTCFQAIIAAVPPEVWRASQAS
jgi:hypothetical protein